MNQHYSQRSKNRITLREILTPGGLVKKIMNLPTENCSDEAMPGRVVVSMGTIALQTALYAGLGYVTIGSASAGVYSSGFIALLELINNSSHISD